VSDEALRRAAIFGGLEDEPRSRFAGTLEVAAFDVGKVIFTEGERAGELYVVLSGEVEVTKKSKSGKSARIALLGPGDCFGEMSLVDVQPRSATLRTLAPSRLLRMTTADLERLHQEDLASYAQVVLNLAREISRRLRTADKLIADLVVQVWDSYLASEEEKS
jgi:CRP/FNR family transcriptional regulator, cyclic AMP receptor protein